MPGRGFLPRLTRAALLVLLLLAGGCGGSKYHVVRGKVLFSDTLKPLTEGEVRFQSVARPGVVASGKIKPDGTFTLATPEHGEGVLEGQCRAAVLVEPRQGKPVLDARFQSFDTSDLRYTVTDRGEGSENYFILEVKRPGR